MRKKPQLPRRERKSSIDLKTLLESDIQDDEAVNMSKRKRAKKSVKISSSEANCKDDKCEVTANGIKQSSGSDEMTTGVRKKGENSLMCHQCQRNDRGRVVHCTLCKTKRFCVTCMNHWYPLLSEQEIAKKCPVCCKNCNCKGCLRKNEMKLTEVNTHHFFIGYVNGLSHTDNWPLLLKVKDWPPESSVYERLPHHGDEFLAALPFKEYTDPRCGPLNLAVKLREKLLKSDLGLKMDIAYGIREELVEGNSVTKLHCEMADAISILTHTSEVKLTAYQRKAIEKKHNNSNSDIKDCKTNGTSEREEKSNIIGKKINTETNINPDDSESKGYGGALWDIWRREDVPKLIEYLKKHSREFTYYEYKPVDQVAYPIHDQSFYLTMDHKRKLKEEYGIEAWAFEQKLGEAVFIPAGCPHQVRNLKSCIKMALNFVSPENFSQCVDLSNETRLLPEGHRAKEDKLEVKKMATYALKKAIDYIEGRDSDVENEKKATADRGCKKRKHQTKKPKRRRRQKSKKIEGSGKEKSTEIDQANNEMKEETEDGNSSELEKHNKKVMTIDNGGALEENGTGNGHNEDETIKSVNENDHKTQIKPKKRGSCNLCQQTFQDS